MRANVFHETVRVPNATGGTDAKVRVYTTFDSEISGVGWDMEEACRNFWRSWRSKYFVDPVVVAAE